MLHLNLELGFQLYKCAELLAQRLADTTRRGLSRLGDYGVIDIIGHSCGTEVHELPYAVERGRVETSDTVIEEGMVFCIEPLIAGMDSPRWEAGIFIQEDMVAGTETGCEVLTNRLGKDLWIAE